MTAAERREQEQALGERLGLAADGNPDWKRLSRKLLRIGGRALVVPWGDEPHLADLVERGGSMTTRFAVQFPGAPRECHWNVIRLCEASAGTVHVGTGYALTSDGLWQQHSWGVNAKQIVETTELREAYFGIVLTPREAKSFAKKLGRP
jgi:hypothetical protein